MAKFKVALAQSDAVLFDKDANLEKAHGPLRRAAGEGADLVIFPEMYLTGYLLGERAGEMAESLDGPSVRQVAAWAKEFHVGVQMGFAELTEDGRGAYDAVVYVDREGRVLGSYRKTHLFGVEHKTFRPGDTIRLFENGIGPQICSDVEFPEMARVQALNGARLLAVSSALAAPWGDVQELHARAHALANHLWVGLTNRVGTEHDLTFTGGSFVADPLGRVLAQAGDEETLLVAEVDFAQNEQARAELAYDYLRERRPALYDRLLER